MSGSNFNKLVIYTVVYALIFGMITSSTLGEVSKESFFSTGAEYLVIQNLESSYPQAPQIYAAYDDTTIMVDINNDGAIDYDLKVNKGGPYLLSFPWNIVDGSKIKSDKPIQYIQSYYHSLISPYYMSSGDLNMGKIISMPASDNLENEYYVMPGNYKFISDNNATIFIDENIDNTLNKNISSTNLSKITISNYSRVFSNNTFFGYSNDAIVGVIGTDFFSSYIRTTILIAEDSTTIYLDYNVDTIIDSTRLFNKGIYIINTTFGTRISSDKKISVFDTIPVGLGVYKTYSNIPSKRTDEISNEFLIAGQGTGHNLIGLFNNYSFESQTFNATLLINNSNIQINLTNLTSNKLTQISNFFYAANATTPLLDYYEYSYTPSSMYYKYYSGELISYKKPYLFTRTKSKFVTPNSSSTFNARVINPFRAMSLSTVNLKFPITCGFVMSTASVNYKKEYLKGGVIEESSKAVTKFDNGLNSYFIFTYDGTIEPEAFLDINFVLSTPSEQKTCSLGPATLSYYAPTWVI